MHSLPRLLLVMSLVRFLVGFNYQRAQNISIVLSATWPRVTSATNPVYTNAVLALQQDPDGIEDASIT